jgi:mannose-6-phosphate isomerase-like protein (cupin superfamily)
MAGHKILRILELAKENRDFRREVVTGPHSQVVLMTILPGSEIGEEVHEHGDQSLLIVAGEGEAVLARKASPLSVGDLVFVPAGTLHNVRNTGEEPLRVVTIYAPPEHEPGTVHATKAEADAAERGDD